MERSLSQIIRETVLFTGRIWFIFLLSGIAVSFAFISYHFTTLMNDSAYLKEDFLKRLIQIERELDSGKFSTISYITRINFKESGVISESSSGKLININISRSSLYKNIEALKTGEIYVTYEPDFIDSMPRIFFIKRYPGHFSAVSFPPEQFFSTRMKSAEYYITGNNDICIYSPDTSKIGDMISPAPVIYKNEKIVLNIGGSLEKTGKINFKIMLDITREFMILLLFSTAFILLNIVIQRRGVKLNRDMNLLDLEFTRLNLLIQGYIASSGTTGGSLPERLDISAKAIEKFLVSAGKEAFVFYESRQVMDLMQTLMGNILQLTSRSKTDTEILRKSEESYRTLIETTSQGYWLTDKNDVTTGVNEALCDMLGFRAEEILGKKPMDFTDEKNRDILIKKIRTIDRTVHRTYELDLISKSGRVVMTYINATTLYDDDLNVTGSFALISDITERKTTVIELRKSRERARLILQAAIDAVIEIDDGGVIQSWNPRAEEMFGWSAGEALGKNLTDTIIPVKYRFAHINGMKRFFASGEEVVLNRRMEMSALNRSGNEFPVELSISSIKTGDTHLFSGFIRDITEKSRAEREIRASEYKFRTLFDNAIDAIIIHDSESRILEVNRAGCERLGYSRDELLTMSLKDFVHIDFRKLIPERIKKIYNEGVATFESIHVRRNKKEVSVEVNSRLIDFNGTPAVLSVSRDMTERNKTYRMMVQTEKMMTVGGLAAGMAHEINNPLGIILQGIQVALGRLAPDNEKNREAAERLGVDMDRVIAYLTERKIFEYLEGIRHAGIRASKIVTDMLQFTRQSTFNYVNSDIHSIIDKTLDFAAKDFDLRKKYDFKNIRISKMYDNGIPPVPCIENEIEQVLLNLLKNSAQSMSLIDDDTFLPEITIRTSMDSGFALIEIEDNGPGMSSDILNRLFEPFYTTKEVGEGTGLGLSISYFIIRTNHNGMLSADSEPGKYARITIKLPLKRGSGGY